jgi:citrate lyase subunit beta/citryl-CoA lyase
MGAADARKTTSSNTSLPPALRSILFVPGSRIELLPKAEAAGPDAIVLDLEDSVATGAKDQARIGVAAALRQRTDRLTIIRFNHPNHGMLERDMSVLAAHSSQVVLVPKITDLHDIREIDALLAKFEANHALRPNSISMIAGIESAKGLRIVYDVLCGAPRVRGAVLASAEEGDLIVDLGGCWTPDGTALAYSRGKFVCDSRAAEVAWILDGAFLNLEDSSLLERETKLARIHGFTGKVAIHPGQVRTINEVFSPSADEIDRAKRLVETFRAAVLQGKGAVKFDGMMIDYANVKRAEQILAFAQANG